MTARHSTSTLVAAAALSFGLAACGGKSPGSAPAPSTAADPAPSAGAAGPAATTDDAMRAECRARAAAQYGMPETAPQVDGAITPGAGDGIAFALAGSVDKGAEGVKTFLCRYSADRRLFDVMATTSDGE